MRTRRGKKLGLTLVAVHVDRPELLEAAFASCSMPRCRR